MSAADLEMAAAAFTAAAPPEVPPVSSDQPGDDEAPAMPTADVLYPIARLAFDKGAPLWAVSDDEVRTLCDAYGALLDKYFPDGFLDRFGVELSAIMVTIAVFGPRWGTPMRVEPKPQPAVKTAPILDPAAHARAHS